MSVHRAPCSRAHRSARALPTPGERPSANGLQEAGEESGGERGVVFSQFRQLVP